jgi:hypothetical protein
LDVSNFLLGGAAIGLLAGFWGKIKAVLWRGANLFVQQVEVPSEPAHHAVVAYLIAHYRRWRNYDRMYGASYEHQRDGRYGLIPYEIYGSRNMIFWNGWWPFLYSNEVERKARANAGKNNENSNSEASKVYSTITFLRGTLDVEEILRHACDRVNRAAWTAATAEEEAKSRFVIHYVPGRGKEEDGNWDGWDNNGLPWYQQGHFRLLAHKPEQLGKGAMHAGSALANLIFPRRVKELIKEIELWRNNRQWYRDKGIPWKRGWLLYGPPGTGKTALARAFAEDLNLPIYVFILAEMGNHELMRAWTEMQVNVPCIALIEDIDNVFHGRENVARKHGLMPLMLTADRKDDNKGERRPLTPLTFDCLLNCLDGVERADGVFTIITTNDVTKVDPALGQPRQAVDGKVEFISTRPGRIDKAVELTWMEPDDKKQMAQRILGEYPAEYEAMVAFIDRHPELEETPAQFQERCGQIALACFWRLQQAAGMMLLLPTWEGQSDEAEVANAG